MSMLTGHAHHVIEKIIVEGASLKEFIEPTARLFQKTNFGVGHMETHKAFMIGHFQAGEEQFDKTVLDLSTNSQRLLYINPETKQFISREITSEGLGEEKIMKEEEWVGQVCLIQAQTTPRTDALNMATGGQQDVLGVKAEITRSFWGGGYQNQPCLLKHLLITILKA